MVENGGFEGRALRATPDHLRASHGRARRDAGESARPGPEGGDTRSPNGGRIPHSPPTWSRRKAALFNGGEWGIRSGAPTRSTRSFERAEGRNAMDGVARRGAGPEAECRMHEAGGRIRYSPFRELPPVGWQFLLATEVATVSR
jgi:hypothetical protein